MLAVGRPFAQALIPSAHVRNAGTFDIELEIAIERRAGGNVRQREAVAGQERPRRQNAVQEPKMIGAARQALADRRPVALRFRRAIVAPEDAHEEIGLERRLRPVHPAVDARALGRVRGPQAAAIVAGGEVSQNGVGFPHRQIAILDHRYASVRVQRPERRLIEPAEVAAGGDVLMGKTELADEPKHFLDVEGAAASPNLEHGRFLLMAVAVCRCACWPSAGVDGHDNAVDSADGISSPIRWARSCSRFEASSPRRAPWSTSGLKSPLADMRRDWI